MNEEHLANPIIKPSSMEHPLYEAICDACRSVHAGATGNKHYTHHFSWHT